MPPFEYYSPDYQTARHRFRVAAAGLNAQQEHHTLCVQHCPDADLSVDVAWIGSDRPEWTVMVTSGLHGVEGFFGSAVQLAWLTQFAHHSDLKDQGRIVFIHALNPYGFHFVRRVNEDNVDLNRNFVLPGQPYEGRPDGYDKLNHLINPKSPPPLMDTFQLKALWIKTRLGLPALKTAIAVGQYDDPQGIFFGGQSAALSTCIMQANYRRWLGGATQAIHLDLHTGLGKFGTYKLLMTGKPEPAHLTWCQKQFGEDRVEVTRNEKGTSYRSRGTLGRWLRHHLTDLDFTHFNAEFGTYPETRTLGALCAENRAHHYGQPGSLTFERVKSKLMECFCPDSSRWRTICLEQSLNLINCSIDACSVKAVGRANLHASDAGTTYQGEN